MSHPPQGPQGPQDWQGPPDWQGPQDWQRVPDWPGPTDGQDQPGPAYGGWSGQPYDMGAGAYAVPQTSARATTSLVIGIASIVVCFLGPLLGIPAIVLGVAARREIGRSGGRTTGDGLALGGIISGVLGSLIGIAVWAGVVALFAFGASFDEVTVQEALSCNEAAQDADPTNDCT